MSWWRYVNALLSRMADDDEIIGLRAAFDYQRALVANSGLTEESFKKSQTTARDILQEIHSALNPWASAATKTQQAAAIDNAVALYKRLIGDPNDPAFQEKLRQDAENQKKRQQQVKPETTEARVTRLITERAHNRAKQAAKGRATWTRRRRF